VKCRECDDFLVDYVSGDLSPEVLATFELHLDRCRNCRTYVEQYRLTIKAGKTACQAAREAGVEMPEELIKAILAARPKTPQE
jgi:anti-sigma factor RsiW